MIVIGWDIDKSKLVLLECIKTLRLFTGGNNELGYCVTSTPRNIKRL